MPTNVLGVTMPHAGQTGSAWWFARIAATAAFPAAPLIPSAPHAQHAPNASNSAVLFVLLLPVQIEFAGLHSVVAPAPASG